MSRSRCAQRYWRRLQLGSSQSPKSSAKSATLSLNLVRCAATSLPLLSHYLGVPKSEGRRAVTSSPFDLSRSYPLLSPNEVGRQKESLWSWIRIQVKTPNKT